MFKTIKNAFKTPDVRKRILYTLLLIVLFRLGCFITVPAGCKVAGRTDPHHSRLRSIWS